MDAIQTTKIENAVSQENQTTVSLPRSVSSNSEDDKNVNSVSIGMANGLRKGTKNYPDYIQITVPGDPKSKFPSEWWKTGIAFVYALFNLVLTTVLITVVHERVPPKEVSPPLPDKFFDYIDQYSWAFSVSEVNGMILVGIWALQWFFHQHKSIVCRRYFFIIGTLYLYRCITMYVTTLPVPGLHINCAPKLNGDSFAKVQRILKIISGGGLTMTGAHMCGDYMYSGHTVMLTLSYLFIKEYSPRRFWWFHIICWCLSAVGVVCILLAREHYTVDVVVAYYVTTRLFWWYHAMANDKALKTPSQTGFLSRVWWFPVFFFFEKNIQGSIPCSFCWPFSWPPNCFKSSCKTYSRVQKTGEDVEKST